MARKASAGPTKSAAIRAYKDSHEDAGPKEISEALAEDGIRVTPGFVSTVLSNERRKGRKGRRKGGRNGRKAARGDSYANLVHAKRMSDRMGGIESARRALNALAKLLGF
jgi:hypothetical protein